MVGPALRKFDCSKLFAEVSIKLSIFFREHEGVAFPVLMCSRKQLSNEYNTADKNKATKTALWTATVTKDHQYC